MQKYQIIVPMVLQRLMILIPFGKQSLLAYSSVSLDDKRFVVLGGYFHIEPLLDHEVVFFESIAGLLLVEG